MTDAQWLWEYEALREKEQNQFDLFLEVFSSFRLMLVKLLGLDLIQHVWDEELEGETLDEDAFIPLSLLTGRREVIEHFLKGMEEKESAKQALDDDEFEKLSAAMASGEIDDVADMEPAVSMEEIDKLMDWYGPVKQRELELLGVKIVDKEEDPKKKKKAIEFDDND